MPSAQLSASGEETSQISGALQGFGMLAREEFEHQKVQRWLENPILKLSGGKNMSALSYFYDFGSEDWGY